MGGYPSSDGIDRRVVRSLGWSRPCQQSFRGPRERVANEVSDKKSIAAARRPLAERADHSED
jgi:hypothetical protein